MASTLPPERRPAEAGSADFPVEFEDPSDAELTWDWDDMHTPYALTPLAAEYIRTLGGGFNDRYRLFGFPQRWKTAIWNGYAFFAVRLDGTDEEKAEIRRRWTETCRAQVEVAGQWWRDEALPKLRALYASIDAVDVDGLPGPQLVDAWNAAWAAALEAWRIHFIAIIGPYQVMDDLADLYAGVLPDAPPGEAPRLIQGFGDDLFAVELGSEQLAAAAAAAPAVAARLRSDEPASRDALLPLEGGPAFVEQLDAFLAEHGHLGQTSEDMRGPSWIEEPGIYLAELARRLGRPAVSSARRRERLREAADELAAAFRAHLSDRPDDLARFEHLLMRAREIGPLTEGHNYWIDRMAQSRLRRLSTAVGRRLVREGSIEQADDVFFLEHRDITAALVSPHDLRPVVEERKEIHARQRGIRPPAVVGAPREAALEADRFDGARIDSTVANELRGTGASAGIARGPARLVLSPQDFARVQQGDIIVCPSSNPSWVPVFASAAGLVTNTGGVLSHAAVVAREFGLPAVVGTGNATERIAEGSLVEIDGTLGVVRTL
jgi:pyruvate,water dikinase